MSQPVRSTLSAVSRPHHVPRTLRLGVAGLAVPLAMLAASTGAPSSAQTVPHAVAPAALPASVNTSANPTNPLANRPWGVYKGAADQAWLPYVNSSGTNRALLAKIALRPKAKWFGSWISNADIQTKVQQYIANSTGGDPNSLVQMTDFRMVPWEHAACSRLPTAAEQASYKQWTDRFAAGIGSAHVALILQPDGPFALCAPGGSKLPSQLIAYAAKKFSGLPNTDVYIDAGVSDWPNNDPAKAVQILLPAGIQYARGFALNSTHYARTVNNIDFGTSIISMLAQHGMPGKHFVINTSSNGKPFNFNQARGGGSPDNAKVCQTPVETVCVTLGIPPTADVANRKWGQSALHRSRAAAHVDAFLWFGRPWLYMQADPFDMSRALDLARTTPW